MKTTVDQHAKNINLLFGVSGIYACVLLVFVRSCRYKTTVKLLRNDLCFLANLSHFSRIGATIELFMNENHAEFQLKMDIFTEFPFFHPQPSVA